MVLNKTRMCQQIVVELSGIKLHKNPFSSSPVLYSEDGETHFSETFTPYHRVLITEGSNSNLQSSSLITVSFNNTIK
jgi:hypothetical protein